MRALCRAAAGNCGDLAALTCPAFEVRITNCQYLEKFKIGDSLESESFLPGSNFGAVSDVRLWSLTFCLGIDSDHDRTDDLFSS
jgi:hypothetical protein